MENLENITPYRKPFPWTLVGIISIVSIIVGFFGFLIWYGAWVTSVDNYEMAFNFNRRTGAIERIEHTGWVVRTPVFNKVHTIDLRPYQVTISANQRILNAKLVRFNPAGLDKFVEWHGRDAGDSVYNLLEILKCYAFDRDGGKSCPFLEVINEVAPSQVPNTEVAAANTER